MTLDEISESYKQVWRAKEKKTLEHIKATGKKQMKKKISKDSHFPASPMPNRIQPQLATLVSSAPQSESWLHELKFDGYRLIAYKRGAEVKLITRNNNDWTHKFKNIADEIKRLPIKDVIIDGEIVILDDSNKSNFQLLQNSIKENKNKAFIYYVFDVMYYDQYNLMGLPLLERKKILSWIISENADQPLRYSSYTIGEGSEIFTQSCQMGMEGIISKQVNSLYVEGRSKNWLKVKCIKRQEFIIGGYTVPKGKRQHFGALLLGYYKDGELTYCGNVGTGFTQASLKEIYSEIKCHLTDKNPFSNKPAGLLHVTWLKPKLVAEIEYTEWTADGQLRHPSFKGLRMDKKPNEIHKEQVTNPDKLLYPDDDITKGDVLNYYKDIHEWILPYIINRPLTLVRCPDNYTKCFYQKHINKSLPKTLGTIEINEKDGMRKYIYIKNKDNLFSLVQLGVLEMHPWGCKIENIDCPDIIVFDLDPAPDVSWKQLVKTAKLIRDQLIGLFNLQSFVKTTGGKGLHVVIPIKPEYKWDEVKNFTHAFVDYLVMKYPDDYIGKMSKADRQGKIFIDYLRNTRGATAIAPYSTRARKHAPVSVPLAWEELNNKIEKNQYTIITLPKRLKKLAADPWKNFYKIKQSLKLENFK